MAAALTRGVSFRRQGSSGLSWTDSWSFNEDGELVRSTKEEIAASAMAVMMGNESSGGATCTSHVRFGGSSLARIHDLQYDDGDDDNHGDESQAGTDFEPDASRACSSEQRCPPSPSSFSRSKSVGGSLANSVYNMPLHTHNNKATVPPRSGSGHLLKWLKKRLSKTRK